MKLSPRILLASLSILILLGIVFWLRSGTTPPSETPASAMASRTSRNVRTERKFTPIKDERQNAQITDEAYNRGVNRTADIIAALDPNVSDKESAEKLADILEDSTASIASREEALGHLVHFINAPKIDDPIITRYVGIMVNPQTHDYLAEQMQAETLNWDNDDTKLLANLEIIKTRSDFTARDAKELLSFYLDIDQYPEINPGNDPKKWENLVHKYIEFRKKEELDSIRPAPTAPANPPAKSTAP